MEAPDLVKTVARLVRIEDIRHRISRLRKYDSSWFGKLETKLNTLERGFSADTAGGWWDAYVDTIEKDIRNYEAMGR